MKKAWRIFSWGFPVVFAALVAALVLFFEQIDPECTCEWDEVWLFKNLAWIMLVPLVPLGLWNCFRQVWWPWILLALYLVYLGAAVMELVPAHYWGSYGYEASMAALCGDTLFFVTAIGFFPAYRCGKASALSGVAMFVLCVLLMIILSPFLSLF